MLMQRFILTLLFALTTTATAETYGPVKTGEMMWGIAGKLHLAPELTRYQAIIALLRSNPHAFSIPCNFNSLKLGTSLTIPPQTEISRLSATEALQEFSRQEIEWKKHRQGQEIQCTQATSVPINLPKSQPPIPIAPTAIPQEKLPAAPLIEKLSDKPATEPQITQIIQFIQYLDTQKIYTLVSNQPIGFSLGIIVGTGVLVLLLMLRIGIQWLWRVPNSYQLTVSNEDLTTPRSPLVAVTNAAIEERLSTLRLCLAHGEFDKVENLLHEIAEKGTPIQQFEGRQLAEIYRTMHNLQEDFQKTQKLLIAQTATTTPDAAESTQQGEYLPQRYLPETKEKVFELVDTIMHVLDKELQAQGQLVEAYQNRQPSPILDTEEYQVVDKKVEPLDATDTISRQVKPTRYL